MSLTHRKMSRLAPAYGTRGVLSLLCVFLGSGVLAGVKVYPTEVFVNPPSRSAALVLSNPADREVEVWIDFKHSYPVSFDTGGVVYTSADTSGDGEVSAVRWLRAIPQRFFLPAQGSQVVRVLGIPPEGTRNGEYWAQVVVSSKERKSVTPPGAEATMRIGVDLVTRVIVPFHFRRGPVTTGVVVRDVATSANRGVLRVKLDLERSGNASFWGRVNCRLIDTEGRVVQKKEFRLAVYDFMSYAGEIDVAGIPAGQYTLELRFDGLHPAVSPRDRIKSNPLVQTVLVSLP